MPICLATAIAEIDPTATYLLNHSQADGNQVILEWRGPGQEPTAEQLDSAWATYLAAQEELEIDQELLDLGIEVE